jgi:hypothetical protein
VLPKLGGLEPGSLEVPAGVVGIVGVPLLPVLGGRVVPVGSVVVPEGGPLPLLPPPSRPVGLLVGGRLTPVDVVVVPVLVPLVLGGGLLSVVPLLGLLLTEVEPVTVGGAVWVPVAT